MWRSSAQGPINNRPSGRLGGQRNRVQLAKMLRRSGNVILLDEPTNDLDLNTLRVLENQNYGRMVIAHDHNFLDRVCTKILDLGNYEP